MKRFRFIALALLIPMVVACSGVPHSSPPLVIGSVGADLPTSANGISPRPGDEPRSIVNGFIGAAVGSVPPDARHSGSRQFLTPDAGSKWQDGVVTVLSDYSVQLPDTRGDTATVKVTGQKLGQLSSNGIYTPQLKSADTGAPSTFNFSLRKTAGQWRISGLDPGVLISQSDFLQDYNATTLYFFDTSESRLVPDLRYSQLTLEPLAQWMLAQMLAGPRPELAQAVQNEIPDQVDPSRATVVSGDQTTVDLPGSAQLAGAARIRLAAQLAYTFGSFNISALVVLKDSGRQVDIPGVGSTFSTLKLPDFDPKGVSPAVQPYYLNNGGLVSGVDFKHIAGPVGEGQYSLAAMALRRSATGELRIAGLTRGNTLMIGPAIGPLAAVKLPTSGTLSRPDWQPATSYAWIAVGTRLYRVSDNRTVQPVPLPTGTFGGGQIVAIRFSPDGVRLALVVNGSDGSKSLWIGSVVSAADSVSLEAVEPISPASLTVSDVAWSDSIRLLMVASRTGEAAKVWGMESDGSFPVKQDTGSLPDPQSIAAAVDQPALLATVGNAVWVQRNASWAPLSGGASTIGYAPTYAP